MKPPITENFFTNHLVHSIYISSCNPRWLHHDKRKIRSQRTGAYFQFIQNPRSNIAPDRFSYLVIGHEKYFSLTINEKYSSFFSSFLQRNKNLANLPLPYISNKIISVRVSCFYFVKGFRFD